jgi:hypothetical protein
LDSKLLLRGGAQQQVSDAGADYFLGIENYSEAIHLNVEDERVRRRTDERAQFIPSSRRDSWI